MLEQTLHWFLAHQSPRDGSFKETYLFNGLKDSEIPLELQSESLTAYAAIAIADFASKAAHWNVTFALERCHRFVASKLVRLDREAEATSMLRLALAASALQRVEESLSYGSRAAETAFEILAKNRRETSTGMTFWGAGPDAARATALALGVYARRREDAMTTEPILRWLNSDGLAASDDLVAASMQLEALSDLEAASETRDNDEITLNLRGLRMGREIKLRRLQTRKVTLSDLKAVEARGRGTAIVLISRPIKSSFGKRNYSNAINVEATLFKQTENAIEVEICQNWRCPQDRIQTASRPTSLEVEIPTGFELDQAARNVLNRRHRVLVGCGRLHVQQGVVRSQFEGYKRKKSIQ